MFVACGTTFSFVPRSRSSVHVKAKYQGHIFLILAKSGIGVSLTCLLAPLAEGQRAIVMAWWRRASVRACVRASVNFICKKLLRNY